MRSLQGRLSFILCCIVLLSACTASNPVIGDLSDGTPAASLQENEPVSENPSPLKMTLALSEMGIFSGQIAGNQDGAYSILSSTTDYSARLLYYDYATRQVIFLSDQLVVTNDAENPGWLEDTFGGVTLLTANDKLYVVRYGKAPIPNIGFEGSASFLLQMEPNAANRKKLTLPQSSLLSYSTGIAADGESLYLLIMDYDANTMQIVGSSLCRTDFEAGRMDNLYRFDTGGNWSIAGVYPEGIILQHSWLPAEYADMTRQEQLPYLQYDFQLYSLREKRLMNTGFTWKQGELSLVLTEGTVYFVKQGETCLYAYDLQTGKEQILAECLLDEILPDDGTSVYLTGNVYDDHIIFIRSSEDRSSHYSYDLSTQKTLPLSLSYQYNGGDMPVFIVAETDRYFLVDGGAITIKSPAYGTDGSFYMLDSELSEYMLIEKEDYWNSVPNYIYFDDTLLRSTNLFE